MKPLSELSLDELKRRIAEMEYVLSGLAELGGGVVPPEDQRALEALRDELKARQAKPRGR